MFGWQDCWDDMGQCLVEGREAVCRNSVVSLMVHEKQRQPQSKRSGSRMWFDGVALVEECCKLYPISEGFG